jgi:imidazolonepropionase-like amidohydrolase/ribosomal protein S8
MTDPIADMLTRIRNAQAMGKQNVLKNMDTKDIRGNYSMSINSENKTVLKIQGETEFLTATVIEDTNKINATITGTSKQFALQYESKKSQRKGMVRLSGNFDNSLNKLTGIGQLPDGSWFNWTANFDSAYIAPVKIDSGARDKKPLGEVWYPQVGYGCKEIPEQKNALIKNATVWTNEKEGILQNTDVLISNGKISKIGKNISASTLPNVETIDGTGKHISAGIIDEHSHIAISGDVNECTQAVTAEVRIGDVVDCDDLQIYRQLSGGVTCSHLLHGSCNPVGGQTQLIKLRWGLPPEEMKVKPWDGFIKFALGENVKQSNWGDNNRIRYPQTRMGVEQVYVDAFTRAREYANAWKNYVPSKGIAPRKDLELEALSEILNKKRFITCHSYVQSEINMLMHVADTFGFRVNTFTHILEGYKVADKMKKHGVGASSFADWWAYKFEVYEAIPYNPKILHDVGVTVAINSDDAEMARRLNQEAAKAITYGNVSQEEALKFVTLNPAKLLHVDDRMGSIKEGKDADVVLWNDNPLSIYARVLQTYVDGVRYYDIEEDEQKRSDNEKERARLIQKMLDAKAKGEKTKKVSMIMREEKHCNEEELPKVE